MRTYVLLILKLAGTDKVLSPGQLETLRQCVDIEHTCGYITVTNLEMYPSISAAAAASTSETGQTNNEESFGSSSTTKSGMCIMLFHTKPTASHAVNSWKLFKSFQNPNAYSNYDCLLAIFTGKLYKHKMRLVLHLKLSKMSKNNTVDALQIMYTSNPPKPISWVKKSTAVPWTKKTLEVVKMKPTNHWPLTWNWKRQQKKRRRRKTGSKTKLAAAIGSY